MADSNFVVKNSLTVNSSFVANSSQVSLGTINATSNGVLLTTSSLTFGNSSVNASINTTSFSGTSNNATNLGGVAASGYVNTSGSYTLSNSITFSSNIIVGKGIASTGNTTAPAVQANGGGTFGNGVNAISNRGTALSATINGPGGYGLVVTSVSSTTSLAQFANSTGAVVNIDNLGNIVTGASIQSANNVINNQTATYTVANTDSGTVILASNTTSMNVAVSNTLPAGFRVMVTRTGTGNVIIANTPGVTLGSRTGAYTITTQYGSASIFMANTTFAIIDGNI